MSTKRKTGQFWKITVEADVAERTPDTFPAFEPKRKLRYRALIPPHLDWILRASALGQYPTPAPPRLSLKFWP